MKYIQIVNGKKDFAVQFKENPIRFYLVSAYSKTAEIDGISAAGLPGMLEYTPPADMEVMQFGKAKCLPVIPESPSGPPSPVIINCAVQQLCPFPVEMIDVGLSIKTHATHTNLGFQPSESILDGANVPVEKLMAAAKSYAAHIKLSNEVAVIAECVPAGTTTAYALCKTLGFNCDAMFASSSIDPRIALLKQRVVDQAIATCGMPKSAIEAAQKFGDNMQPFSTVLAAELSKQQPVVLAGGTQMLAVYALMKSLNLDADYSNIAVVTTPWVVNDPLSDFAGLARMIDPEMNTFFGDFAMTSEIENLVLYEKGLVKEGVGAGACIAYALSNGITPKQLLTRVEETYRLLYG